MSALRHKISLFAHKMHGMRTAILRCAVRRCVLRVFIPRKIRKTSEVSARKVFSMSAQPRIEIDSAPAPDSINPHNEAAASSMKRSRPPKRQKEPRPDHFLSLRLSHHTGVVSALSTVQQAIGKHTPQLKPALVDPAAAHLTLGVLSLPDDASRDAAVAALRTAAAAAALTAPLALTLRGVGHFSDQVVWMGVGEDDGGLEKLQQVATAVRGSFKERGLLLQVDREFQPHVTVAKLSKMQPWASSSSFSRRGHGRGGRGVNRRSGRRGNQENQGAEEGMAEGVVVASERDEVMVDSKATEGASAAGEAGEGVKVSVAMDCSNSREDTPSKLGVGISADAAAEGGENNDGGVSASEGKNNTSKSSVVGGMKQKKERIIIPREAYADCVDISTTAVAISELHLCAMAGRKQGAYYSVLHSVSLLGDGGGEMRGAEAGNGG